MIVETSTAGNLSRIPTEIGSFRPATAGKRLGTRARMFSRKILAPAFAAAFFVAAQAGASPVDAQIQAARELFQQAVKDEDAGHWSEAFTKLQRVAEVKATAGVRYHIALCEEHLGQIATALTDYGTAEHLARAEGAQDVLRLVGKQMAVLGPRVPRLTIHLVPDAPDAQLRIDGVAVARALVGVPIPLDPGEHRIDADAPDRPPTSATVTLGERDTTLLNVKLNDVATPPAPAPPASPPPAQLPPASPPPPPSPGLAIATTALAAGLAGGGVVAFLLAGNAQTSGESQCAAVVSTAGSACDSERATVRAWDFSAAGMWVGAAALGAVAVWLWASTGPRPTAVGFGPGTAVFRGTF